jgi:hypothetical protein
MTMGAIVLVGMMGGSAVADMHEERIDRGMMDDLVSTYNDNAHRAPDLVTNRLADNEIELRVGSGGHVPEPGGNSGMAYYIALDEDGRVVDYGEHGDPDIRISTSENAIEEILRSPEGVDEISREEYDREDVRHATEVALDAYETEDIVVEGVAVTTKVEVETGEFAVWSAQLFNVV